jgi:hypothetical protein
MEYRIVGLAEAELQRGKLIQQFPLKARHFTSFLFGVVVVSGKVEETVEGVEKDFVADFESIVVRGLCAGDGGADDDFAVGEGDDVGLGRVVEEIGMDARDGGAVDQDNLDVGQVPGQGTGKERQRRLKQPPKRTDLHWNFALLV